MKRRNIIRDSALLDVAAFAGNAFAQQGGSARFGDTIIPPSEEMDKEKHVPIIDMYPFRTIWTFSTNN